MLHYLVTLVWVSTNSIAEPFDGSFVLGCLAVQQSNTEYRCAHHFMVSASVRSLKLSSQIPARHSIYAIKSPQYAVFQIMLYWGVRVCRVVSACFEGGTEDASGRRDKGRGNQAAQHASLTLSRARRFFLTQILRTEYPYCVLDIPYGGL
jgi:hypothetical protein